MAKRSGPANRLSAVAPLSPTRAAKQRRPADFTSQRLGSLEVLHSRTRNPVHVWEAIGVAVEAGCDIPDFAIQYLCRVATAIGSLSTTAIPKANQIAKSVYRSLEFNARRGAVNPFRVKTDSLHHLSIAAEVHFHVRHCGDQEDHAYDQVALEHPSRCDHVERCHTISRATVARHWRTWRPYFQSISR
jgi:hypothetical protein